MLIFKLAFREFKGGFKGLAAFFLCLILGTLAISAINSTKKAIDLGLSRKASEILGGDIRIKFTYRFSTITERKIMENNSSKLSETTSFRSMATATAENGMPVSMLIQVKGVDNFYPVYGQVKTFPKMALKSGLEKIQKNYGVLVEEALLKQLNVQIGDEIRLGDDLFQIRGKLLLEPDLQGNMLSFAPRVLVYNEALQSSGLIGPGTMFDTNYLLKLHQEDEIKEIKADLLKKFQTTGAVLQDRNSGILKIGSTVNRVETFLFIVALSALAVGGVGVALSVHSYLETKASNVAVLRTMGASENLIFSIYLTVIIMLSLISATFGSVLGFSVVIFAKPFLTSIIKLPIILSFNLNTIVLSTVYGLLTALLFSIWPLGLMMKKNITTLLRGDASQATIFPGKLYLLISFITLLSLVLLFLKKTDDTKSAIYIFGGIIFSSIILLICSIFLKKIASQAIKFATGYNFLVFRLALSSLREVKSEVIPITLALGIGLIIYNTIWQVDINLRRIIDTDLFKKSPAFFILDIQNSQLADFRALMQEKNDVLNFETAPMLRGIITKINDLSPLETVADHWIFRGDRGVSFSNVPPPDGKVLSGEWWEADYDGVPQLSFSAQVASEIGLHLGDTLTINILGREIKGTITSLRDVDFSSMQINFLIIFNSSAIDELPHANIASIFATEAFEEQIRRRIVENFPNVTAIPTRNIISYVNETLLAIGSVSRVSTLLVLSMGLIVIIGVTAANQKTRAYEASILKALGVPTRTILAAFVLRSFFIGITAASFSTCLAISASWAILVLFFEATYVVDFPSILIIVLLSTSIAMLGSVFFGRRTLAANVSVLLRAES